MNYDQEITKLLAMIKVDKSLAQPWKNYATKELNVAQALIRMAKTTTNIEVPLGMGPKTVERSGCTCPTGAESADCPVHGHI